MSLTVNKVELIIKPINQDDFSDWTVLYKKYLAFYKTELTEAQLATLWSWFFDTDKQMYCYAAIHENKIVGLVHFREYLRPIKAASAVFIDDLYVENKLRGMGIAQRLIKSVNDFCLTKQIPLVRWATAHDNQVAMRLYDKIATQTQWKIYDMAVM
jgi:GNAT superfamily N-acetyltransferase